MGPVRPAHRSGRSGGGRTFLNTLFPTKGPCSAYPKIVQGQYAAAFTYNKTLGTRPLSYSFFNIGHDSCVNGWACGNVASDPESMARFNQMLFDAEVVSNTSLAEMLKLRPLTTGWSKGLYYGLGLMGMTFGGRNETLALGHGGQDYGSFGFAARSVFHNFSWAIASNSIFGMNCSLPDTNENFRSHGTVMCELYEAVLSTLTAGKVAFDCRAAQFVGKPLRTADAGEIKCT